MNDNSLLLFVSSYGSADEECIRLYAFDPETGESQYVSGLSGISNPSFLCFGPDGKHLYAVGEDDGETASANTLLFNDNLRTLELISSQPTLGGAPCNICVSPDQREVITSNYVGGSISVFPILDDQSLSECQTIRFEGHGPNAERQEQAHLHAVNFTPDGQYMLANDLGTDRIHLFPITKGESVISQPGIDFQLPAGAGPRHLCFSPTGQHAFLLSELSGEIFVLAYDAASSTIDDSMPHSHQPATTPLRIIQTLKADTLDAGGSADIHCSPDGRFLYASHRLQGDGISIYSIAPDANLTRIGYQPTGKHPRNFTLSPDGRFLLVACRDSHVVQVFSRDADSGLLTDTGHDITQDKPVCVLF